MGDEFRLMCLLHPLILLDPTPREAAPFTLEHLLPELMGVASKWQSLGKFLSLDEDLLDEIFTNNERDEACLQVMLEHYLMRSDKNHSWEEIDTALKRISREETAADTGTLFNFAIEESSVLPSMHLRPFSEQFCK